MIISMTYHSFFHLFWVWRQYLPQTKYQNGLTPSFLISWYKSFNSWYSMSEFIYILSPIFICIFLDLWQVLVLKVPFISLTITNCLLMSLLNIWKGNWKKILTREKRELRYKDKEKMFDEYWKKNDDTVMRERKMEKKKISE